MGNKASSKKPKSVVLSQRMNMGGCMSDMDCMNPDAARSSPETGIVYSCPGSYCQQPTPGAPGTCVCSDMCEYDRYSGTCCQDVIDIRGDKFCIEYTEPPKLEGQELSRCKMDPQYHTTSDGKRVLIPGDKICEWCVRAMKKDETDAPTSTEGFASVDTALNNFMY